MFIENQKTKLKINYSYSFAFAILTLIVGAHFWDPIQAITLNATCNGEKNCEVEIDGERIFTDSGIDIFTDNIIGWSVSNSTNTGGAFFLSTNEDYRFLIKHFDNSGKRKITQIGFYNFKSAQSFLAGLELLSGLAPNHDQAGAATFCTARGKDAYSGTQFDSSSNILKNIAPISNAFTGAVTGSAIGSTRGPQGAAIGALGGMTAGAAIGISSGDFTLKRNVVSEVRNSPSSSKRFLDNSFNHRRDCIDEPSYRTTNVTISSPIPVNNQSNSLDSKPLIQSITEAPELTDIAEPITPKPTRLMN